MIRALSGFCFLVLFTSVAFGQTADAPAAATFEIADVHVSGHVSTNTFFFGGALHGDRYVARYATMLDLITDAYGFDSKNVVGGPSWLETTRFDVIAKVPPSTSPENLKLMLQALLAERFKLVVHPDTRPMPVFALTLGKGKPKLKEADGTGETGCQQQQASQSTAVPNNMFSCRNMTTDDIAKSVLPRAGAYLPNPVVDMTGLKGSWNFDIMWTGRGALAQAGPDGISIFDAVDKQLGLRLEPQKVPMSVLVVDGVNEKPTDNPPDVAKSLPPAPPAEFEVAVIKPSAPGEASDGRIDNGQISFQAITLKDLITLAWSLNPRDTESLAGAPKWLDSDKFDILAKASTDVSGGPAGAAGNPQFDFEELQLMLRALLIDRFKMQIHTETRSVNGFVLLAANPKMKKADPANRAGCKNGPGPDGKDPRLTNPALSRLVSCQNVTMAEFAEKLPTVAGGYIFGDVLNSTGLEGAWDFTLSFSPAGRVNGGGGRGGDSAQPPVGDSPAADPSGALSLFDAISKQLGLKLDRQKRPMPVLVIDHVEEKPTDN
jgi:uncharacterized protein (TIGR03435 family)